MRMPLWLAALIARVALEVGTLTMLAVGAWFTARAAVAAVARKCRARRRQPSPGKRQRVVKHPLKRRERDIVPDARRRAQNPR